ncbi:sensor histidine kinase [Actinocrispum sp. NPDC049592]|uniref:sensor histidine kinase n=1 Tax=Actinocrispum sp. NPDC049592 TaxID=3154835 RepID=UPI00344670F8
MSASLTSRIPAQVRTVTAGITVALSPVALAVPIAFDGTPYLLFLVALVLPFFGLRRWPWVVLGVQFAELLLVAVASVPGADANLRYVQMMTMDLVVATITARVRPRVSIPAAVLTFAAQLTVSAVKDPGNTSSVATSIGLLMITMWLTGTAIRLRRQYRDAQREQAEIQAVQAERLRIARELHDMIAHSIGVIAFQAGMGGRVIDTQPAEARNALRAIEETSRDTLAGLRRMLTALRRDDPVPAAVGLADLDGLVARSRQAGVKVDIEWRGDRRPLLPDIDLSAFRIIQEAVTNVVRHAGTSRCDVLIDQRDEEVLIEVTDEGRGGSEGAGYGIPGMRERVALLDGDFSAGPRPEGGFKVSARIPVPMGVR